MTCSSDSAADDSDGPIVNEELLQAVALAVGDPLHPDEYRWFTEKLAEFARWINGHLGRSATPPERGCAWNRENRFTTALERDLVQFVRDSFVQFSPQIGKQDFLEKSGRKPAYNPRDVTRPPTRDKIDTVCTACYELAPHADSCTQTLITVYGAKVGRVPFQPDEHCPSCGVARGGFHHSGPAGRICICELCPSCGGRLAWCLARGACECASDPAAESPES